MARKRRSKETGPREKALMIRIDDDEKRMLQEAARRRGTSMSLAVIDAIRLMLGQLDQEDEEKDSPIVDELKSIRYELRRIGVNVNQIAHWTNREMEATGQDEASAWNAVRRCRELVAQVDAIMALEHNPAE